MKKLLALLLAVVLVFGLAACSTNNKKENSTDGAISEAQTDTTPSTENTETTEPSEENTEGTENATDATEETTTPTEGSDNTENKPSEETTNKNDKETQTPSTNRPVVKDEDSNTSSQKKDDTMFNSYEAFVSAAVTSKDFSLTDKPSNLTGLTSNCSCNIKFTGDLKNGNVSVTINGKSHTHGWSTSTSYSTSQSNTSSSSLSNGLTYAGSTGVSHSVGTSQGQMLTPCDECGFVMGKNFIYIKLPGKSHGHGWSWPEEKNENKSCNCLDFLTGDFKNGSYSPEVYGIISGGAPYICGHSWSTSASTSTGVTNTITESVGTAIGGASVSAGVAGSIGAGSITGSSASHSSQGLTGVPPCPTCGFRKYENIYGSKIITFRCLENGGSHTIDFTTFHKIGEKVNCPCGLTTSGNKTNGSFGFAQKYSSHGHGWSTSISVGNSTTHSSSTEGWSTNTGSSQTVGSSHSTTVSESWSTGTSHSVGTTQGVTNSESWSTGTSHSTGSSIVSSCSCEYEEVENGFIIKCPATNKYHVINYS